MMMATTKEAMSAKTHVCPVAKEKAAPGLRTRTSPSARPSSAVCSPSARADSTQCLVAWSTTTMTTATSHSMITGRRLDRFLLASPSSCGFMDLSMALKGLSVGRETTLSTLPALPALPALPEASSTEEAGSTWSGMGLSRIVLRGDRVTNGLCTQRRAATRVGRRPS